MAYLFFVRPNARSTVHSLHQTSVGRTQGKFRRRAKASSKRKYERLLLAAVQELLQQDPDVSVAEAQLALDGSAESSSEKETCPTEKGKEAITQTCFSKAFSSARSERPNQAMQRTANRRLRNFP